jgi:hypothetical protein
MAYVVARRSGRFEIRESLYTANGPRSRSLAGFGELNEEVLAAAARRARRPFDADAVISSGRRAGAPVRVATSGGSRTRDRFLAASKNMASTLGQSLPQKERRDAGAALMELLGFADMVRASQPPRRHEPLAFPSLSQLTAARRDAAALARRP